jgi:hypothetical protein
MDECLLHADLDGVAQVSARATEAPWIKLGHCKVIKAHGGTYKSKLATAVFAARAFASTLEVNHPLFRHYPLNI